MAKPIKKIWKPDRYEVEIGEGTYIIEPQPIERIIEFDTAAKAIGDKLGSIDDKYIVTNGTGERVDGPFDDENEAIRVVEDKDNSEDYKIVIEKPGFRDILDSLVSAPYPVLQAVIPDLKEEHVRQSSLPQLKHTFVLIADVNGVTWFERVLKKYAAPLLPELMNMVLEVSRGALQDFISESKEEAGEKE